MHKPGNPGRPYSMHRGYMKFSSVITFTGSAFLGKFPGVKGIHLSRINWIFVLRMAFAFE